MDPAEFINTNENFNTDSGLSEDGRNAPTEDNPTSKGATMIGFGAKDSEMIDGLLKKGNGDNTNNSNGGRSNDNQSSASLNTDALTKLSVI